jgi:hypothetical protein
MICTACVLPGCMLLLLLLLLLLQASLKARVRQDLCNKSS